MNDNLMWVSYFQTYPVRSLPRGLALIVNIEHYEKVGVSSNIVNIVNIENFFENDYLTFKVGRDLKNLNTLFTDLGFEVS